MTEPKPVDQYGKEEAGEAFRALHDNVFLGLSTHQIIESVPNADDVEEGQFVLGKDGATWKLYTKINGNLYSISLTAI